MSRSKLRASQCGLTLIELLLATSIAALLFAGLNSVVMLGLKAQASGTSANEQAYSAGFALERLVAKTRAATPKFLSGGPAATTRDWLAPLMFCLSTTGARLMETTSNDSACGSGTVLAEGVAAFTAELTASPRPADAPAITYSLTLTRADAPQPVSISANVRLGGGTQ